METVVTTSRVLSAKYKQMMACFNQQYKSLTVDQGNELLEQVTCLLRAISVRYRVRRLKNGTFILFKVRISTRGGSTRGPSVARGRRAPTGSVDTGSPAGPPDTGSPAGPPATGSPAGPPATGSPAGPPDTGSPAGPPDTGSPTPAGPLGTGSPVTGARARTAQTRALNALKQAGNSKKCGKAPMSTLKIPCPLGCGFEDIRDGEVAVHLVNLHGAKEKKFNRGSSYYDISIPAWAAIVFYDNHIFSFHLEHTQGGLLAFVLLLGAKEKSLNYGYTVEIRCGAHCLLRRGSVHAVEEFRDVRGSQDGLLIQESIAKAFAVVEKEKVGETIVEVRRLGLGVKIWK